MHRFLANELLQHFSAHRQMAFVSGPRQVGKSTIAHTLSESQSRGHYFNWDNEQDRSAILQGPARIAELSGADMLATEPLFCAFDELHKYKSWRDFLKGLFDEYEASMRVLLTGSARLDTFKRGGDSLMGRYFSYTLHPLSLGELLGSQHDATNARGLVNHEPRSVNEDQWQALLQFGGFPEPFLKADMRFFKRWQNLRTQQLLREDIRDLTRVQELGQLEHLAVLLRQQTGQLTSYTSLAKSTRVSIDTIRRWISILESLYYCFAIRPWHQNISRALRKEPKYYLWDWSQVDDVGARAENLVACALLKAVDWWRESGEGDFGLHFIRDKDKREVDFLVTRDQQPWFLVEVKSGSRTSLSPSLHYYHELLGTQHAFQVSVDLPFVERDCFEVSKPVIVPARTFLAQLV